jgi:hypothetical protein
LTSPDEEVPEDEKEEELPDVEFPSKLTYGEKLMKMKKWQTPKKKKEGEKEDAIGNDLLTMMMSRRAVRKPASNSSGAPLHGSLNSKQELGCMAASLCAF